MITANTAFEPKARSRYEALVRALPEEDKSLLARKIARWVLTKFKVEDPRLWEAVAVAERYADGLATVEELRAAREAARSAAGAAAWAAVWAAEGDAENTARAAAQAATWAADRDDDWAAQAAFRAAARDAAYQRFFEWALELVIGEKVTA